MVKLSPTSKKVRHSSSEVVTAKSTDMFQNRNIIEQNTNLKAYYSRKNLKILSAIEKVTIVATYSSFNLIKLVRLTGNSPVR